MKIIASLERLGEGFRILLWEKAKALDLSPIQIQILIFVRFHSDEKCKVTYLAREFNLTKSTVSEAVKSLEQKGLLRRQTESLDNRSHTLHLSEAGELTVARAADFADPMLGSLAKIPSGEKDLLLERLLGVIAHLQQRGIISIQRMCFSCRFYRKDDDRHFCAFLDQHLVGRELRVDCREFEAAE